MFNKSVQCQQEYDTHEYDDPQYLKQNQTYNWDEAHDNVLIQDAINKYQCNFGK